MFQNGTAFARWATIEHHKASPALDEPRNDEPDTELLFSLAVVAL